MQLFQQQRRIIVTCNRRLATFLQKEITELGFKIIRPFPTGMELRGTLQDCIWLNLNLRCASQVLFSLKEFSCNHPNQLYDVLVKMPWENIFDKESYFSVTSNVFTPNVNNNLFANVRVKDAIVDRFREQTGQRPNSGPELEGAVVHLFWLEDFAEIFMDTSGETLAKHGYRRIPGKAPMLEALASATILASNWNRNSPFINPMCGSGTLAIEAALIATKRSPGLFRKNYGFMHITGYEAAMYEAEKTKLTTQIHEPENLRIVATDISEDAINISKINAGAAGVLHLMEFAICDFAETKIDEQNAGVVFFNPEYGERLGNETELETTYSLIGDFMKKQCKGYMGYIFTGNLELAKKIGLKPKRRIEFYNGKIDCRLLEYELYAGTKRIENSSQNITSS